MPLPPRFPLRRAAPQLWAPMTDAEWARLEPLLRRAARGRPPADLRRSWDAIFWVALSRGPWGALPPELGRADTAHRALRRFARAGGLLRLLIAVSDHPLGAWEAMRLRVCRACRRVAKLVPLGFVLAAERLGLADALPCAPHELPRPLLSESIRAQAPLIRWAGRIPSLIPYLRRLHRLCGGNPRAWRLA